MSALWEAIVQIWNDSGFCQLFNFQNGGWKNLIMIGIACFLVYLAIKKQYEPLLLLPIAFGMLLVNLPLAGVMDPQQNSLVPFTNAELTQYIEDTYDQNYPVFSDYVEISATDEHLTIITTSAGKEVLVYKDGDAVYKVTPSENGSTVHIIPTAVIQSI